MENFRKFRQGCFLNAEKGAFFIVENADITDTGGGKGLPNADNCLQSGEAGSSDCWPSLTKEGWGSSPPKTWLKFKSIIECEEKEI